MLRLPTQKIGKKIRVRWRFNFYCLLDAPPAFDMLDVNSSTIPFDYPQIEKGAKLTVFKRVGLTLLEKLGSVETTRA
jgi:hypothetical protein